MMTTLLVSFFGFYALSAQAADECESFFKYVSLKGIVTQAYYMRVDSIGKHLIFSGNKTVVVDITDPEHPKATLTSMTMEAYPIESGRSWKWIASSLHNKSMQYFDFDNVIQNGTDSKPVYEDDELNEFYHSAAELPGSKPQLMKFRTSIWSKLQYRDYTARFDDRGKLLGVTHSATHELCPNLKNVQFRQPILSKDGREVAGLTKNKDGKETTKVFKIREKKCELDYDVGINTSKVSFSYPKRGVPPWVTFTASFLKERPGGTPSQYFRGGVWVFDPKSKQMYPLNPGRDGLQSIYPGFTEDDRVFFVSIRKKDDFGVTIVDLPNYLSHSCYKKFE